MKRRTVLGSVINEYRRRVNDSMNPGSDAMKPGSAAITAFWSGTGHIPQPHRVIEDAAGQGLAVWAERQRVDLAFVAGEGFADLD